jgi:ATP-dependent RNA helicase RhlE
MHAQTPSPETPVAASSAGFGGLGIAPRLLTTLDKLGFTEPTPIQRQSIPVGVEGADVIGIAQTGTGKTLAFGIPLIQNLARRGGKGLVILPTRELAQQVEETFVKIGRDIGLRTAVIIGGAAMGRQIEQLRRKPHIVVGTPGRIIDHLERRSLNLSDVSVLVLDEADRMLDMGFWPQITRIIATVPKERQTMLFSATMPDEIVGLATSQMKQPVRIEVARAGTASERVAQELFVVRRDRKEALLKKLLVEHKGSVLVFARTKIGCYRLAGALRTAGVNVAELHADRSQSQRKRALDGFRNGAVRVLVATDIAARGIDVTGIELVVNYDVPDNAEDYVHRIGRTGRAGREGKAVTFATPDQGKEVSAIERLVRMAIPINKEQAAIEGNSATFVDSPSSGARRGGGRGGRSSGGYQGRNRAPFPAAGGRSQSVPPMSADRGGRSGGYQGGMGPRRSSYGDRPGFAPRGTRPPKVNRGPRRDNDAPPSTPAQPPRQGGYFFGE